MGQSANYNGGQSFNYDRGTLRIDTAQIAIAQASTATIGGGNVTIGLLDTDND